MPNAYACHSRKRMQCCLVQCCAPKHEAPNRFRDGQMSTCIVIPLAASVDMTTLCRHTGLLQRGTGASLGNNDGLPAVLLVGAVWYERVCRPSFSCMT